jgi:hypothetical protein
MRALDKIYEEWITEEELSDLMGITTKRLKDMKSNDQIELPSCRLSSRGYYYHVDDVLKFMREKLEISRSSFKSFKT